MGKAETISSKNGQVDEKLLKPFTLGWTREVVKRVVAKNPTCDIYYFSPDGKKLRSLREVKAHLTDRLAPDCFSFKREILGVGVNFETVRNANSRKKTGTKKGKETGIQPQPSFSEVKKRKLEMENSDSSVGEEAKGNTTENTENNDVQDVTQKEAAQDSLTPKRKRRNALAKMPLSDGKQETSKRAVSKEVGESRTSARKKPLQEAVKKVATSNNEIIENTTKKGTKLEIKAETILKKSEKQVSGTSAETESKTKNGTFLKSKEMPVQSSETETKGKRNKRDLKRNEIQVQNTNAEAESESEEVEEEQKLGSTDLKSIVQKNIGKYRKLREKQKLKLIRTEMKKSGARVINNSRAESFLKNRSNYLKPLQKGWKRELVYRSNCSKAGLQADVYYFHPSGKKFRSSREILENPEITGGLSIEFFTFRKEAIGCGEPLEVVRKARIPQKH